MNTMQNNKQRNGLPHGYFKTTWFKGHYVNGGLSGLIIYKLLNQKVYYAR